MIDAIIQKRNENKLRVIKTAKTEEEINEAARNGFFPLVKKVVPSEEIRHQLSIVQCRKTGEIRIITDRRTRVGEVYGEDWERVVPFYSYYPVSFPNPYAAYLIPPDIIKNEKVFVEEIIEDITSARWQFNTFRLKSGEAVWDGVDLRIIEGQGFEQEGRVVGNRRIGKSKIVG
ncbi:hypothetical protein [Nafulsella turpanensis]|uniref:hypothetical protein n=1 Tax=Nafulsella turpanensis TaxID=1265690 RepID=UPI00036E9F0D|nr:hypothetical protein [Nafulsella turpanensis]